MLTDAPQCGGQRARSATQAADAPGTTGTNRLGSGSVFERTQRRWREPAKFRLQAKTAHDSLGRTGHHCHGSCAEARGVRLRRGTGQVVAGGDTAPGPLDVLDG